MTKTNNKRRLKRKGTDSISNMQNMPKLNQKEKLLFGKMQDLEHVTSTQFTRLQTDIARIDRQTGEFVNKDFNILKNIVNNIDKKLNVLVDILLDMNADFSEEQMKILDLEEEVEEKPEEVEE